VFNDDDWAVIHKQVAMGLPIPFIERNDPANYMPRFDIDIRSSIETQLYEGIPDPPQLLSPVVLEKITKIVAHLVHTQFTHLFDCVEFSELFAFQLSTKKAQYSEKIDKSTDPHISKFYVKQGVHVDFSMVKIDNSNDEYTKLFNKYIRPALSTAFNELRVAEKLIISVDAASVHNGWPIYGAVKSMEKPLSYFGAYVCQFHKDDTSKPIIRKVGSEDVWQCVLMARFNSPVHPMHAMNLCFKGRLIVYPTPYALRLIYDQAVLIPISVYGTLEDFKSGEEISNVPPVNFIISMEYLLRKIKLTMSPNPTAMRMNVCKCLRSLGIHYNIDTETMFELFSTFSMSCAFRICPSDRTMWDTDDEVISVFNAYFILIGYMSPVDANQIKKEWCDGFLGSMPYKQPSRKSASHNKLIEQSLGFKDDNRLIVHSKYVDASTFLLNGANVISSALGSGKTTALITYIRERVSSANGNIRVVVVGPRVSFCESIYTRIKDAFENPKCAMDVLYYKSDDDVRMTHETAHTNWLMVVQYESLWKIPIIDNSETVIIMDESESILSQIFSGLNKRKAMDNFSTLQGLARSSNSTLICMDAFVSSRTMIFAQSSKPNIKTVDYVNIPPKRTVNIFRSEKELYACLVEDLQAGKKVYMYCSHKKDEKNIIAMLIDGKVIGADTNDKGFFKDAAVHTSEENEGTSDVASTWSTKKLVICTSTVTVGVNFDEADCFDVLYSLSRPGAANVRDMFQALARVRYPSEGHLNIFVDKDREGDLDIAKLEANMKANREMDMAVRKKGSLEDHILDPRHDYINSLGTTVETEKLLSAFHHRSSVSYFLQRCNYELKTLFENDMAMDSISTVIPFYEVPDEWSETDEVLLKSGCPRTTMYTLRHRKNQLQKTIELDMVGNSIDDVWKVWQRDSVRKTIYMLQDIKEKRLYNYDSTIAQLHIDSTNAKLYLVEKALRKMHFDGIFDRETHAAVADAETVIEDTMTQTPWKDIFNVNSKSSPMQSFKAGLRYFGLNIIIAGKSNSTYTGYRLSENTKTLGSIEMAWIKDRAAEPEITMDRGDIRTYRKRKRED
jgi:hypothetical protein